VTSGQEHPAGEDALTAAADVLRRRAEVLAHVEEEDETTDTLGLLLFTIGAEWYGLALDGVREILGEYVVTRLPGAPEHIAGVTSVRGDIVSVTDFGTLVGAQAREPHDVPARHQPAIIVGNEECETAIMVDAIGDIIEVPSASIEPPLPAQDRDAAPLVAGSLYDDGRLIGIVSLNGILAPIGEIA
jgi:purine-binding chemotaxis protein CheW